MNNCGCERVCVTALSGYFVVHADVLVLEPVVSIGDRPLFFSARMRVCVWMYLRTCVFV